MDRPEEQLSSKLCVAPANEPSLYYAERLSTMIQAETVSYMDDHGQERFVAFRQLMRQMFPHIFAACAYEDLGEAFIMRWPGTNPDLEPVLLMHHHDVVEATPGWQHDPFGGEISEGRVWGCGTLDMVGVGEKAQCTLRFTAKSEGGHASTPTKGTPLARLGHFIAAVEKQNARLFPAHVPDALVETLRRMAPATEDALGFVFKHAGAFRPVLQRVMPMISGATNALTRTTLAFTMASGSDGVNVLPTEAWVIADIRSSHHQGAQAAIAAVFPDTVAAPFITNTAL